MFSHFTDGKTGTETVSSLPEVTASKRNEEASPGSGPTHRCESVPVAGPLIWEGAPALAQPVLPSGLSFKKQGFTAAGEHLPSAREAPADAKGLSHEAGEDMPWPSPVQVRLVCSWDSRL